jgi:hypothetical protein
MLIDVHGDVIETTTIKDGRVVRHRSQDVEGYFKRNAAERAEGAGWKGDFHKVASIPLVVFEEMCKQAGVNLLAPEHKPKLMAMLNERDWLKVRTKEGRV